MECDGMGITELFESGFFTMLWNWSNPVLTVLVYGCIMIGVILQIMLRKKCRSSIMKWSLMGICLVGIIVSECAWYVVSGWERLGIMVMYGFVLCVMLGAIIATAVLGIKNVFDKRKED
jgi:peptidoglycan/LPS O-acetylase OafA/YrhL